MNSALLVPAGAAALAYAVEKNRVYRDMEYAVAIAAVGSYLLYSRYQVSLPMAIVGGVVPTAAGLFLALPKDIFSNTRKVTR